MFESWMSLSPFGLSGLLETYTVESQVTGSERAPILTIQDQFPASALVVLLQLRKDPGPEVCPPLHRAKKIRNKAVVNTSTLMRESRGENERLLLGVETAE